MVARRTLLSGVGASIATGALASAPASSIIPLARPVAGLTQFAPQADSTSVLASTKLTGKTAFVVSDASTGQILASHNPLLAMPTASVAKAITAQYALEALGPTHQFATRILATGSVSGGVVDGDLILVGGGDPMLDTDDLAGLVDTIIARGIRRVNGRFRYFAGSLPYLAEIDKKQPAHLGYNPAISGLNLNFNRIYFEWKKAGEGYDVSLDARSERYRPSVPSVSVELADRGAPVYDYKQRSSSERWSVSRGALGNGGGRWLPVRQPDRYAAEVVRALALSKGLRLSQPTEIGKIPIGFEVAQHQSIPLHRIVRSMLYYSTNLIAEVVGLHASNQLWGKPNSLRSSANGMNNWMKRRFSTRRAKFVDHSGLGDQTRVTAQDMVSAMVRIGPNSTLASLMRKFPMPKEAAEINVQAKTGSLNFVSGLSGFARAGERDLAFAIFSADIARRNAIKPSERERPRGAKSWATQARHLQHELIKDWASVFRR